jgi:hypothetical protein
LKTLVPALRNVFSDTPFILGGGVTIEPDVVFDNMPIDICVHGEDEHTIRILNAGDFSGYEVLGVIDDYEEKWGQTLEGVEVIGLNRALDLKPDVILISSDRFENILFDKCGAFLKDGIAVIRPYKMHEDLSKS